MEIRTIELPNSATCTICSLSERHFWRVHSLPPVGTPPEPPVGYTLQVALDNVTSFRERYEQFNMEQNALRVWRALGSARILARELESFPAEHENFLKLCLKYSYSDPDATDDPVEVGRRLGEILAEQTSNPTIVTELYLWLQEKAGGIDHAMVDEILKRVRSESERRADPAGSRDHPGSPEPGAPDAPFDFQPAI